MVIKWLADEHSSTINHHLKVPKFVGESLLYSLVVTKAIRGGGGRWKLKKARYATTILMANARRECHAPTLLEEPTGDP